MKRQTPGIPDKPVLDEKAFQRLLSAAFVLQKHKERGQEERNPESAFGQLLTQIVEIQEQIRNARLDLQAAATLVARRLCEMTEASGAAIGILDGNDLEYFAAAGRASGELGARAPFHRSLAAECLRTGLILRCPDAEKDRRLRPDLCRSLNAQALIAVPILCESKVGGVLELHFAQADSFREEEVRACQLLAASLAEALARETHVLLGTISSPEHPAETPAPGADTVSTRAALEKIEPPAEQLLGSVTALISLPAASCPQAAAAASGVVCAGCGHRLADGEFFCGLCGACCQTPSTGASLGDRQREAEKSTKPRRDVEQVAGSKFLEVLPAEVEAIVAQFPTQPDDAKPINPALVPVPSVKVPLPTSPDLGRSNGNKITPSPYRLSINLPPYSTPVTTEARLPVRIFGTDAGGRVFSENVFTVDISREGAKLTGVRAQTKIGEIVGISNGPSKSRFLVKWVGQPGTPREGQVGVQNITPEKYIWEIAVPTFGINIHLRKPATVGEKRQHSRMQCSNSIQLRPEGQSAPIWGRALDLSDGGCFVEMPMALPRGTKLSVGLWLNQTKLMLTGRVVNSRRGFGIGIQFTGLGPQDAAHMRSYLKSITRTIGLATLQAPRA